MSTEAVYVAQKHRRYAQVHSGKTRELRPFNCVIDVEDQTVSWKSPKKLVAELAAFEVVERHVSTG